MSLPQQRVRFLIISDTHDFDLKQLSGPTVDGKLNQFGLKPLPPVDVVLHCGNFTENGGFENHQAALEGIAELPAEVKLVIAGYRDLELDRLYCERRCPELFEDHERVKDLWTKSELALSSNVKYLEEGSHCFRLNSGASFTIHASPYTQSHTDSAFQFDGDFDRWNGMLHTPQWAENVSTATTLIPCPIDILMTHGPPKYILDDCDAHQDESVGCWYLRRAVMRVKPRLHCFGHAHKGYGAQRVKWRAMFDEEEAGLRLLPKEYVLNGSFRKRGYADLPANLCQQLRYAEQTLFVNAAVGDMRGGMDNVPWIIDLMLEIQPEKDETEKEKEALYMKTKRIVKKLPPTNNPYEESPFR